MMTTTTTPRFPAPTTAGNIRQFVGFFVLSSIGDDMTDRTLDLTEIRWNDFIPARYLSTNTVDPDFDIDGSAEFGDHDDNLRGLTVHEPGSVLDTIRFLNGYSE